jgi:hypothetical protein
MSKVSTFKTVLFAGVASVALTFAGASFVDTDAFAQQKQQGKGQGGSGQGGGGGQGGHQGAGQVKGQGGKSMEDIMRSVSGEDEDESDRPAWAGKDGTGENPNKKPNQSSGTKKGDLYGDAYVILRDENGVPILSDAGFVQPIDADGNLIPLDDEGHPVDESLTLEVELGRLNVGRAPTNVLLRRADEVVGLLNTAEAISIDAAGRLVLTVDGEEKTIDSPLENLAIYVALMTEGSVPGVTADLGAFSFLNDGALTADDYAAAVSFLAGGADKTMTVSPDQVIYLNQFLDVEGTIEGPDGVNYVDFSTFTYDRASVYADRTVTVLIQTSDGVWEEQTINVYDAVFGSTNVTDDGGIDSFAQATDDARAVINYVHEYAIPADEVN